MRIFFGAVLALALSAPVAAQTTTPSEVLRSSVSNFIRPQIKSFAREAETLTSAVMTLCTTPSAETLAEAKTAFSGAATAYGRVEFLRLGPLMEDNRADRLLFWPDRRSIGLKQVQAVLAASETPSLEELTGKSVAVQGFGALEFVLFGTGQEALALAAGQARCGYGKAIAQNIAQIAAALADGWSDPNGIAKRLTQPDPANTDYRDTTEALEALIGVVAHGIENVRDTRINPFLPKDDAKPNPRLALFWRSEQTIPMLRANVSGLRQLVELSGMVSDGALAAKVTDAFDRANAALDRVTDPIDAALADPAQIAALGDLVVATQDLQRLIGEELSSTLGLSVGFSSLDGD
ncbi:peptidase M75, Imelysin [Devosia sp. BK]|uniref:imelysin family protein n=1 Tax=Devosia sp. BK TaxID=2871706 RepID=UPI00293955C3|nr:imelysin family protein [Devosia sp. BK]MDV3253328.1 peptidase M75, Imelysin [Devosia sp. BK]